MDATLVKEEVATKAALKPIKRFELNNVLVAVFANQHTVQGEARTFYNVAVSRRYVAKDGKFARSHSFGMDDLGALMTLIQQASEYIQSLEHATA